LAGRLTTREYLSLTISVNHDIIDGAPAARFGARLLELIESGYRLGLPAARAEQPEVSATTAE
jgi:pyruvate/2-oxoglutarate dehydrogenase complex dihydrolipoamide acyltransferase (E2) component